MKQEKQITDLSCTKINMIWKTTVTTMSQNIRREDAVYILIIGKIFRQDLQCKKCKILMKIKMFCDIGIVRGSAHTKKMLLGPPCLWRSLLIYLKEFFIHGPDHVCCHIDLFHMCKPVLHKIQIFEICPSYDHNSILFCSHLLNSLPGLRRICQLSLRIFLFTLFSIFCFQHLIWRYGPIRGKSHRSYTWVGSRNCCYWWRKIEEFLLIVTAFQLMLDPYQLTHSIQIVSQSPIFQNLWSSNK